MGRMSKCFVGVCALLILITSSPSLQTMAQTPAANGPDQDRAMLSTYCFTCHNSRVKIGGLALDGLNPQTPEDNAQIWEKAIRKLVGPSKPAENEQLAFAGMARAAAGAAPTVPSAQSPGDDADCVLRFDEAEGHRRSLWSGPFPSAL